jgi:hypothetical protein
VYPVTVAGGPIAAVPNGKGSWTVAIEHISGSTGSEPGLFLGGPSANTVLPTYVSPYDNQYEGSLGLQFDGEEVICPTSKTIGAKVEVTVSGVTSSQTRTSLLGSNCLDIGRSFASRPTIPTRLLQAAPNTSATSASRPARHTTRSIRKTPKNMVRVGRRVCRGGGAEDARVPDDAYQVGGGVLQVPTKVEIQPAN